MVSEVGVMGLGSRLTRDSDDWSGYIDTAVGEFSG
jgi:hypothetical protein